ncbi:hypothetical protein OPQ81_000831 [Rhizoctonia solani]|nr:hypothetical protein OPQ81_000831 [Rhizoctonia solani]
MRYKKKLKGDAAATSKEEILSPINTLPSEILVRIFLLTVESQTCPLRSHDNNRFIPTVPEHPDSLLLVCSRWHDIAISLHSLWSHIDIALSYSQHEIFLGRAKAYVARAEGAPLDIHLVDPGTRPQYQISTISDSDKDATQLYTSGRRL